MNTRKAVAYIGAFAQIVAGFVTLVIHLPTMDVLRDVTSPWVFISGGTTVSAGALMLNSLMKEARKERESKRVATETDKID